MNKSTSRVPMLDILRGAALIGMIFHHSLVSYEIVFGTVVDFLYTKTFEYVQLLFVAVFLLVSGICTNYSRSVLKRGLIVFAAAMLMTLATCVILPKFGIEGLNIYFGILHMFGLSMIIYALAKKAFQKIPAIVGIVLFSIFFIAYYVFYSTEPTSQSWLFLIFGVLPDSMLYYGDYYPLFPFFFLFITGTYIGKYIKEERFPDWFYTIRCKPLEFCGKKSLWVYVLHQPIIFPLMLAIYYLK